MKMRLSISNIAWASEQDEQVYALMRKQGYLGLEIAPTRIFPKSPYDKLDEAADWAYKLRTRHQFIISSIQSIWFGRQEKLFGSENDRNVLIDYTKKAIDFASVIGCRNLVFGCPRNRFVPREVNLALGVEFFRTIGDYAVKKNTIIGMEANPPIYNTNYINDTKEALELIEAVSSPGFKLNLDIGTMIQNGESVSELKGKVKLINHIHISEPELRSIKKRELHRQLKDILNAEDYQKFISIEMGKTDDVQVVNKVMGYVKEIFG